MVCYTLLYCYMPKKRFKVGSTHGFIGDKKSTAKPKVYTPGVIEQYILEREISIGDEKSKQWLKEHE
jgi:hypothetical protein